MPQMCVQGNRGAEEKTSSLEMALEDYVIIGGLYPVMRSI